MMHDASSEPGLIDTLTMMQSFEERALPRLLQRQLQRQLAANPKPLGQDERRFLQSLSILPAFSFQAMEEHEEGACVRACVCERERER